MSILLILISLISGWRHDLYRHPDWYNNETITLVNRDYLRLSAGAFFPFDVFCFPRRSEQCRTNKLRSCYNAGIVICDSTGRYCSYILSRILMPPRSYFLPPSTSSSFYTISLCRMQTYISLSWLRSWRNALMDTDTITFILCIACFKYYTITEY